MPAVKVSESRRGAKGKRVSAGAKRRKKDHPPPSQVEEPEAGPENEKPGGVPEALEVSEGSEPEGLGVYQTTSEGEMIYPRFESGKEFYHKDAEGNEIPIPGVYARYPSGTQIYPKKSNGDEFYLQVENREIPAVSKLGTKSVMYYAKRANGEERYPRMYLVKGVEDCI